MQISRSGRANDLFLEELAKRMPKTAETEAKVEDTPKETQLAEDRKDKDQKAEADATTEKQLPEAGEREDKPVLELPEKQLEKSREASRAAAKNADMQGITEERLNDADKSAYPHRNEKAHERTGDKRPINALREELGSASDEAKRDRQEKADTSGPPRLVDQDVGSQLTNPKTEVKAFNLKKKKVAAQQVCSDYLSYKNDELVKTAGMDKFAEVRELDEVMTQIMETAQNEKRALSHEDMAKIVALKDRKSALLLKKD